MMARRKRYSRDEAVADHRSKNDGVRYLLPSG